MYKIIKLITKIVSLYLTKDIILNNLHEYNCGICPYKIVHINILYFYLF